MFVLGSGSAAYSQNRTVAVSERSCGGAKENGGCTERGVSTSPCKMVNGLELSNGLRYNFSGNYL